LVIPLFAGGFAGAGIFPAGARFPFAGAGYFPLVLYFPLLPDSVLHLVLDRRRWHIGWGWIGWIAGAVYRRGVEVVRWCWICCWLGPPSLPLVRKRVYG
jgi:hypothetical protein